MRLDSRLPMTEQVTCGNLIEERPHWRLCPGNRLLIGDADVTEFVESVTLEVTCDPIEDVMTAMEAAKQVYRSYHPGQKTATIETVLHMPIVAGETRNIRHVELVTDGHRICGQIQGSTITQSDGCQPTWTFKATFVNNTTYEHIGR